MNEPPRVTDVHHLRASQAEVRELRRLIKLHVRPGAKARQILERAAAKREESLNAPKT